MRVAINGFGRIGRAFVRQVWDRPDVEIVAINDLGSLENLAYLLRYDSVYGRAPFSVEIADGKMVINGTAVAFVSEKDPTALPWKEMNVDVVVEVIGGTEGKAWDVVSTALSLNKPVVSANKAMLAL